MPFFDFPNPVNETSARLVAGGVVHRYSPGPPKRLAQGIGLTMSATATVLATTGRRKSAYRVLGTLIGAASLEAAAGVCVGCKLFAVLMRTGVVPDTACEACDDIWSRYPGGRAAA